MSLLELSTLFRGRRKGFGAKLLQALHGSFHHKEKQPLCNELARLVASFASMEATLISLQCPNLLREYEKLLKRLHMVLELAGEARRQPKAAGLTPAVAVLSAQLELSHRQLRRRVFRHSLSCRLGLSLPWPVIR